MRVIAKLLFLLAAISLAISYTRVDDFLGGAFKPLAAILFIVAYILQLTKNEVKQYDEDRRRTLEQAHKSELPPQPIAKSLLKHERCRSGQQPHGRRIAQRQKDLTRQPDRVEHQVEG